MRPLDKKSVGESITLYADIHDLQNIEHIIQAEYKPYGEARKVLLANFGNYCSYCETYLSNGALFQTEHVQPKGLPQYATLEFKWDNFLLSCATCNNKKHETDVKYGNVHLPHKNNTFLSFIYKEAGVVEVNTQLQPMSQAHAKALIDLLKLEDPDSDTDQRREMRRKEWDRAKMYLKEYKDGRYELNKMISDIKERNCWSIWFTVFQDYPEVRKALVEQFPGTSSACFDEDYNPVFRNPENLEDPV